MAACPLRPLFYMDLDEGRRQGLTAGVEERTGLEVEGITEAMEGEGEDDLMKEDQAEVSLVVNGGEERRCQIETLVMVEGVEVAEVGEMGVTGETEAEEEEDGSLTECCAFS